MIETLLALALLLGVQPGAAPAPAYAEGQVWEYRTRPGEEGSLLRIQHVEPWPAGDPVERVYHISVIGVRVGGRMNLVELPHLPVSRTTLDASVTRLSTSTAAFPAGEEGRAMWREAQGGVFTIPLAEIVAAADDAMRQAPSEPPPPRT
jgi:hypothetical protein